MVNDAVDVAVAVEGALPLVLQAANPPANTRLARQTSSFGPCEAF
jgi:hypothetical protein